MADNALDLTLTLSYKEREENIPSPEGEGVQTGDMGNRCSGT
jgi:hypothetical protein